MPKKKTILREAEKKAIGEKQKKAYDTRLRVRMHYGSGLDDLEERNEDVNQPAARIVTQTTQD